jgi:hypothetical protein
MGANAQTSVPAFTSGQVLTAAQVTGINTGIPVFASSTERDAAFGGTGEKTLAEGQMAYLEDTNATQYYDGSSWAAVGQAGGKILQVVRATDSTDRSTTSTSFIDANLSVTITPTSATSTILLLWTAYLSNSGGAGYGYVTITDSSNVSIESAEGTPVGVSAAANFQALAFFGYDSPATISATTYKARFRSAAANNTFGIGNSIRTGQMIAMEVGA